jgi:hypothetical protein
MRKNFGKKLQLSKQTVRELNSQSLGVAAGGAVNQSIVESCADICTNGPGATCCPDTQGATICKFSHLIGCL